MFKKGQKVVINTNTTLKELQKNNWCGCKSWTLDFINNYLTSEERIFTVMEDTIDTVSVELLEIQDQHYKSVNPNVLKLAPVKKMTLKDIEEQLGYPFEIIEEQLNDPFADFGEELSF